jgi:putative transposase
MSGNVYSEIYLHITWYAKDKARLIQGDLEKKLYDYLRQRIAETPGVTLHQIGGMEDHLHLAVAVPPSLTLNDWIRDLKGSSAHHFNHEIGPPGTIAWQPGYGVVSFGKKDLPFSIEYIRNQKARHAGGQVYSRLERVESEE